jgi:hypothetical protein
MTHESQKTLAAVRALALKDLEAASDEDIRAEFDADGTDPDQLAASIAQSVDEFWQQACVSMPRPPKQPCRSELPPRRR